MILMHSYDPSFTTWRSSPSPTKWMEDLVQHLWTKAFEASNNIVTHFDGLVRFPDSPSRLTALQLVAHKKAVRDGLSALHVAPHWLIPGTELNNPQDLLDRAIYASELRVLHHVTPLLSFASVLNRAHTCGMVHLFTEVAREQYVSRDILQELLNSSASMRDIKPLLHNTPDLDVTIACQRAFACDAVNLFSFLLRFVGPAPHAFPIANLVFYSNRRPRCLAVLATHPHVRFTLDVNIALQKALQCTLDPFLVNALFGFDAVDFVAMVRCINHELFLMFGNTSLSPAVLIDNNEDKTIFFFMKRMNSLQRFNPMKHLHDLVRDENVSLSPIVVSWLLTHPRFDEGPVDSTILADAVWLAKRRVNVFRLLLDDTRFMATQDIARAREAASSSGMHDIVGVLELSSSELSTATATAAAV